MNPKPGNWLVIVLSLALIVSGCTSPAGQTSSQQDPSGGEPFVNGMVGTDGSAGEPTSGGTLNFVTYSEARSLDPAETIATGASGGTEMAAIYDVLVRYNPATGEYEPRLAKSLDSSEDSTRWTLRLRKGVSFSDGTALNSTAAMWSIERYLRESGELAGLWQANVRSMEATDDRTVVFTLRRPWPGFAYLLASGPGMMVGRSAVSGQKFTPVGAGPFELEHYAPQEELVLTARSDYWAGEPHLNALRFTTISGGDAKLELLENDQADMAYIVEPAVVTKARQEGYEGYMQVLNLGRSLLINHREQAATSDPRVRKAVARAINPRVMNQRVYEGKGIPQQGLFAEASKWDLRVEPLGHNLQKAKQLLSAAKADGYDGTITFAGVGKVSRPMGVALRAMLERVGFSVQLDFVSSITDLVGQVSVDHDFDLAVWGLGTPDAAVYPELYTSFHSTSSSNPGAFADTAMDRLIEKLQTATSAEQHREILGRIQQRWNETIPAIPIAATPEFLTWQQRTNDVTPSIDNIMLFDDTWIDQSA